MPAFADAVTLLRYMMMTMIWCRCFDYAMPLSIAARYFDYYFSIDACHDSRCRDAADDDDMLSPRLSIIMRDAITRCAPAMRDAIWCWLYICLMPHDERHIILLIWCKPVLLTFDADGVIIMPPSMPLRCLFARLLMPVCFIVFATFAAVLRPMPLICLTPAPMPIRFYYFTDDMLCRRYYWYWCLMMIWVRKICARTLWCYFHYLWLLLSPLFIDYFIIILMPILMPMLIISFSFAWWCLTLCLMPRRSPLLRFSFSFDDMFAAYMLYADVIFAFLWEREVEKHFHFTIISSSWLLFSSSIIISLLLSSHFDYWHFDISFFSFLDYHFLFIFIHFSTWYDWSSSLLRWGEMMRDDAQRY